MGDSCIVSVAFRIMYVRHSKEQERVLLNDKYQTDRILFRDELPMKGQVHTDNIVEEFQKSLYGFKPHAIQKAIDKGFKKVVWFDPSVLPVSSVKVLFDSLDTNPMIVIPGDSYMDKMANKKAKDYFNVTEQQASKVKHIGGTIYGFNFNDPKVLECFNLWKKAEEDGIFGNQDEFMAGHWADEACMSLSMYKTGIEQYKETKFEYLNQKSL